MKSRKPRTLGGRNNPRKPSDTVPFYQAIKDKKKKPVKIKKEDDDYRYPDAQNNQDSDFKPFYQKKPIDNTRFHSEEAKFSRSILMSLPERNATEGSHEGLEPLAHYPYFTEQMVKLKEFSKYWSDKHLDGEILPLIPAPEPRNYRAHSRRKVFFSGHSIVLGFGEQKYLEFPKRGMAIVAQSSIEPEMHYDIFLAIAEKLATKPYKELSEALNFIIIRDTGEKAIIFNVFEINGEIVRKLKLIAEMLQKSDFNIVSAWMYHDPNRSEYFLDHKDLAPGQMKLKKLFGFDMLKLEIEEIKFQLSPFILSQVNIPMLRIVVKRIQQLLSDIPSDARLLDLYCGYGLFSHTLSSLFSDSLGLDSSASGIESAKSLVQRRLKAGHTLGTLNFKETYITKDSIKQLVPQIGKPEYIIIDPPRHGTAEGVIAEIALRKPVKVIHLFCAIDQIVKAMAEWKRAGYIPTSVQALDMYPGTPSIETLVVLEPDTDATPTRSYRIRYRP